MIERDPFEIAAESAEPSEVAVARVIRSAERSLDAPPRRRPAPWLTGVVGATLGALIVGVLLWPDADPAPRSLRAEAPIAGAIGQDVALRYAGRGEVTGDDTHPRLSWEAGSLEVEVTPGRHIDLQVQTPEGTATVVGTGFVVNRDALGTRVDVRHGVVAVSCQDGRAAHLTAGQSLTCMPVRASGLLARARALQASGASTDSVIDTLDAGLRLAESAPLRTEIAARRVEALATAGRKAEALAAAVALLAGADDTRRVELTELAVGLAVDQEDCEQARTLAEGATLSAELRAALDTCADP